MCGGVSAGERRCDRFRTRAEWTQYRGNARTHGRLGGIALRSSRAQTCWSYRTDGDTSGDARDRPVWPRQCLSTCTTPAPSSRWIAQTGRFRGSISTRPFEGYMTPAMRTGGLYVWRGAQGLRHPGAERRRRRGALRGSAPIRREGHESSRPCPVDGRCFWRRAPRTRRRSPLTGRTGRQVWRTALAPRTAPA